MTEDFSQTDQVREVLNRIDRAKRFVAPWHDNIRKWRRLYNLQHYKTVFPEEPQFNDPTYTNTVDLAVGIMLPHKVRWHSFGFSPSKKEQQITGKVEKMMEAIWEINDEREERSNMYELFLNYVRDGGGIVYSPFDPKIAAKVMHDMEIPNPESETGTEPVVGFDEPPIRVQVVDPLKFFLLPGGPKRWLMMGRSEEMSVLDIEMIYGKVPPRYEHIRSQEEKAATKGEFIDAWDFVTIEIANEADGTVTKELAIRNCQFFDKHPMIEPRTMIGYADLPYSIQFFKPTSSSDPNGWHNIMVPLEPTVTALETIINRRSYQIDVYTGLPLVARTTMGRKLEFDPGLFKMVTISKDESLEFPTWPGNAPDMQLHIEFLRSRVQQSGFSDVMFGSGPNQIAGYALSQLGDQNRIRLQQPIKHMELMLSTWAKKVMDLISVFAENSIVHVFGRFKGENYDDYIFVPDLKGYSVRSELKPSFPAEDQRKSAQANQARGILSMYTIRERFYDIEQPEDEEERVLIETAQHHPATVQYGIIKELKQAADDGDEAAAMALQLMMRDQIQQQEGRKENPPNTEQFAGAPSPTGEATSQEQGGMPAGQSFTDQYKKESNRAPELMP